VMLPPIFVLAVLRYYREGHINVPMAAYVALGFVFGALVGAHLVQGVSDVHLKRAFGILVMLVGMKMAFLR